MSICNLFEFGVCFVRYRVALGNFVLALHVLFVQDGICQRVPSELTVSAEYCILLHSRSGPAAQFNTVHYNILCQLVTCSNLVCALFATELPLATMYLPYIIYWPSAVPACWSFWGIGMGDLLRCSYGRGGIRIELMIKTVIFFSHFL